MYMSIDNIIRYCKYLVTELGSYSNHFFETDQLLSVVVVAILVNIFFTESFIYFTFYSIPMVYLKQIV